jgi:hypothetical protein
VQFSRHVYIDAQEWTNGPIATLFEQFGGDKSSSTSGVFEEDSIQASNRLLKLGLVDLSKAASIDQTPRLQGPDDDGAPAWQPRS